MIRQALSLLTLTVCLQPASAADGDPARLTNAGFDDGLSGWVFRPGDESQATVEDAGPARGHVLRLHPEGRLLGVETARLKIGEAIQTDQAYEVELDLKCDGLEKGVFAVSMYCFDAQGKSLKQIVFYHLNPRSKPHAWRKVADQFGPGTSKPLPEGTQSVCLRFSFHESGGDCRGTVWVDNLALRPCEPAAQNGWPAEIVADVGDLQVRFESRSFWTLYRIDYRSTRLCIDRFGSHYGSVANFPDVGFIGSGHTENENEQVLEKRLTVDGQPVDEPAAAVRCNRIELHKKSRIRSLLLETKILVNENRILEEVQLRAEQPTPVNLIYHFMHPWTPTATEYCAELLDGTRVEGSFTGDKSQKIDKATRWSAIYDGPSQKGAVSYVLSTPQNAEWRTRYWDQPERYRKHYFVTFLKETVPADVTFRYRMLTVPFESTPDRWKQTVASLVQGMGKD